MSKITGKGTKKATGRSSRKTATDIMNTAAEEIQDAGVEDAARFAEEDEINTMESRNQDQMPADNPDIEQTKAIGRKLKEIRQKRGYTLEEVAKAVGGAPTTISKYESGRVLTIPYPKLKRIAAFLEVNPASLVDLDPSQKSGMLLSINEQLMMEDYRMLSTTSQETVNILIRRLLEVESNRDRPAQLFL